MNKLTGVIANRKQHEYSIIPETPISKFKLRLGTGREWKLGIDPASKFTGIALIDNSGKFVILLDCSRDTRLPDTEFYNDLYYLLKRLVSGQKILLTVVEKPFVNPKFRRASEVLLTLRGKIEEWVRSIPELANSEFAKVNSNAWKSQVIDKRKGKNRFNAIGTVAEDLCDKIPELNEYRVQYHRGDLDAFDALGVVFGYESYAYTDDGRRKIAGPKEKMHRSLVGYVWVSEEEMGDNFVSGVLGDAVSRIAYPKFLEYNENYSFSDNIMMATTSYDAAISIIPRDLLQQFQWKFGIDVEDTSRELIMFMFRKGHFTASQCDLIKGKFSMSEEYGGW